MQGVMIWTVTVVPFNLKLVKVPRNGPGLSEKLVPYEIIVCQCIMISYYAL